MRVVAAGVTPSPLCCPPQFQPMNGKHLWVVVAQAKGAAVGTDRKHRATTHYDRDRQSE